MEGMVEVFCLQRISYRTISVHCSPDHTTYTLRLLQFQEINSTCVFRVVTIHIKDADYDRNGHCYVQRLSRAVNDKRYHDFNEYTLPVLKIHHQVPIDHS